MRDPYLYPGTNILKNKFHIMEESELKNAQADYVILSIAELITGAPFGVFDFDSLCQVHDRLFGDIFDCAGKIRLINIEKEEAALGGLSVEYTDVFDVKEEAEAVLADMNEYQWEKAAFEDIVTNFADFMARLWKVHPFREGNTRTVVLYCVMFIEAQGIYIESGLFQEHIEYTRRALAAASAVFKNVGDLRRPEYLYRIVRDGLEQGKRTADNAVERIIRAGFPAAKEQIQRIIYWDRRESTLHGEEEIRKFLKV